MDYAAAKPREEIAGAGEVIHLEPRPADLGVSVRVASSAGRNVAVASVGRCAAILHSRGLAAIDHFDAVH